MNYRPMMIMSDGERASNGLVFATREEALDNAFDLLSRWTTPIDFDVEETSEPVNYRWADGALVSV